MNTETHSRQLSRRSLLGVALSATANAGLASLLGAQKARAAQPVPYHGGRVNPPLPMPNVGVELADGSRVGLVQLLSGRATALHLMFTGCTTSCPIQAAVFQRVQSLLPKHAERGIQLVSLSISPLEDTSQTLSDWLKRVHAQPGWIAAKPTPEGLDAIQNTFSGGRTAIENHATEVSIVSRRAELIWRTYELPSAETVAGMLNQL